MRRMMVEIPIPPKWKQLWNTCDLRVCIILSLWLQTFLILVAPLRKRTKRKRIIMPLWSAYLLADWAASFSVGLISSSQWNPFENQGKKGGRVAMENMDLLSFWSPFLLVHLGGPDTITAFALEDNELWRRHLLGLVFQCVVAVYVFVQSLPHNRLWIPTTLMFLTGIIKYAERTRALYLASTDRFKDWMFTIPNPGTKYEKLLIEYYGKKAAKLPTRIQMVPEPDIAAKSAKKVKKGKLTKLEQVQYAYQFFETFKGLYVDMIFNRKQWMKSRDFFLNRTAKDAFKVVEIELNFFYEILFTKLPVVFGLTGGLRRFLSFATISSAIVLFIFESKTKFKTVDVMITYALLFGALVLDMTALFMLAFSDWTIIYLWKSPDVELDNKSRRTQIITAFLRLVTEGTIRNAKARRKSKIRNKWEIYFKGLLGRRWSESIPTYNLIYYCLHPCPEVYQVISDKLGLTDFCSEIKYVKSQKFTPELRDFIFKELKAKSELADDFETAKEISSARGDLVIRVEEACWGSLLEYVVDVDYDQSIIVWHIATDLCYNKELSMGAKKNGDDHHRHIAKLLSDYMLYLLIMQPNMMSVAVAGIGQIRFRDTCAEANRLFDKAKRRQVNQQQNQTQRSAEQLDREQINKQQNQTQRSSEKLDWEQINACMGILDVSIDDWNYINKCMEIAVVPTEEQPGTGSGDRNSLLFDSCRLAKELMDIEEQDTSKNKWLIISKVWVELLCYGASHSRSKPLVEQVSKGGELITIVWLLMAHFGLGDHFQFNDAQARAKLIVGK